MKNIKKNNKRNNKKNLELLVLLVAFLTLLNFSGCMSDQGESEKGPGGDSSNPAFGESGGNSGGKYSSGSKEGGSSCPKMNYGSPDFSCDCSHVDVDLPFNYSVDSENLFLNTDGAPVKTFISPWGAHAEPFTGHYTGNHKSDWQAVYAASFDEMTELAGDGDGICERGEKCGVHRDQIASRQVQYVSPGNRFMVTDVFITSTYPGRGNEFSGEISWQVTGWLCNYRYTMGYIDKIDRLLREKMIAAGYSDPDLESEALGGLPGNAGFNPKNLITGAPIVLEKGDGIGLLNIRAEEIPSYPGYFRGWGGMGIVPYSPLEYNVDNLSLTDGYNGGIYKLLPQKLQDSLEDVFYAEARKGNDSIKFSVAENNKWLWAAQMKLSASEPVKYDDHSSIFSWLGGWGENNSNKNCQGWDSRFCDQRFALFKIHKDTPFYDANLYDSSDVSFLVTKAVSNRLLVNGEVLSPANINPISGILLVKWRTGWNKYQRIAYRIDAENQVMKIRWGVAGDSTESASNPEIPTDSENCDGEVLVCMDHNNHF